MTVRSLLFVPGNRPERFDKALAAPADRVCIDLEDAVAPPDKARARGAAVEAVNRIGSTRLGVRINGALSEDGALDACAVAAGPRSPAFVMIPKVEAASEVAVVRDRLGAAAPPLWPLIESAEGLRNAWEIAAAPGVAGVLFGGADFAADIGAALAWEPLLYARGLLVAACARAGVELLDVPYLDVRDSEGLLASTERVKLMGFTGRACIHPDQVALVNLAFSPLEAEVERARRVLAAYEQAGGGVALLDGKLVERPVIRAAERVLARAAASS